MDTRTFVSDSLLHLTGASDPTVIDFVLATAGSAKTVNTLHEKLTPFLEGSEDEVFAFCGELHRRVGSATTKDRGGPTEKKNNGSVSNAAAQKKKYQLVEMGGERRL